MQRRAGQRHAPHAQARLHHALDDINRVLALYEVPDLSVFCGRLLTAGMRACADLAERARARRDQEAAGAALSAAGQFASWVDRMAGVPFADHPPVATIPAERATWDAERTRLTGVSDPAAWQLAAQAWQDLGWPHRAGYAWWRRAEALLSPGRPRPAATALQAAAAAARRPRPAADRDPRARAAGADPAAHLAGHPGRTATPPGGGRALPADRA
jgi:hypothetical protein